MYKDYEKQFIGYSNIGSLVLAGFQNENGFTTIPLHFGQDGSYSAYIIEGDVEIGSHYEKRAEFDFWLKIYDDEELVRKFEAKKIAVYRAAEMGCIINILN